MRALLNIMSFNRLSRRDPRCIFIPVLLFSFEFEQATRRWIWWVTLSAADIWKWDLNVQIVQCLLIRESFADAEEEPDLYSYSNFQL